MKIEQQVGGSRATQDAYTGEARQITVDTDNWDMRLHDGVTPGGLKIINRDNGDERWQAKSVELAGIAGFAPSQRGMLVRLGAGSFRVRKIDFNSDQLTVTNPDGYAGNPTISINTRIETDHIFGGDLIVEGVLQVDGGINANTSGTHEGPVIGDVTGNLTGDVTGNLTGDTTGTHTGDVDLTGAVLTIDDGAIPLSKIAGLLDYIKLHGCPLGAILEWSGDESDIPAGWALCDGLNGTPDLRDKFIFGAGSLFTAAGDTGGSSTHAHATTMANSAAHTHTFTDDGHALTEAELASHWHGMADNITRNVDITTEPNSTLAWSNGNDPGEEEIELAASGTTSAPLGRSGLKGDGDAHSHSGTTAAGGIHSHALDNVAGSSMPPYYALCFIMHIAI